MVSFNLNLAHVCGYTFVAASLPHVKLINLVYIHTVACNCGVHTLTVNTHDTLDMHIMSSHLICLPVH